MELSALTLRVLLLFFPGVLCAMLVDALTVHRERTAAQFLTNAFVLGLTSYLLLYAAQWVCAGIAAGVGLRPPLPVTFIDALLNEKLRIAWGEIVLAVVVAVLLGFVVSGGLNHQLLHRAARRMRISRKRGSQDLWSFVLGAAHTNWISARDLDHGFTYFGWLEEFSETVELAELWLRNVAVFESEGGTKLFESDGLYLGRDPRSLVIEIVPMNRLGGAKDEPTDVRALEGEHVQQDGSKSQPHDAASGLHPGAAKAATTGSRSRRGKGR